MNEELGTYSWFKVKKDLLASLLSESAQTIEELSMSQFAGKLQQLSEKVSNDSFKIQIVGTFSNGKSTFINALLGENILPTRALPCTAVVNEIKYGKQKRAVLHFVNPLPEKLIDCIPDATMRHMQSYEMKDIPPLDIEYDQIEHYVQIPLDGDPEEISAMSPYKTVELFYPSPLLKEGVEIIDSPGLNEADERTAITLEYLDKADAVIYLLDANRPCAKDEVETIEDILIPKGFNDMFFVANRIDQVPERERADIKKYIEQKVGKYTPNAIYCVSALQSLEGKIEGNTQKLELSGMPVFEKRLTEFLTKDKGRIKLAQPARELNNILSKEAIFGAIPSQRRKLSTDLSTLQARYDAVQPELRQLEDQKKQMHSQMLLRIERSKNEIRRTIIAHFRVVSNKIPAWVQDFKPKSNLGFPTKGRVRKVTDEIVNFVSTKVKEDFKNWNEQVLVPLIEEKAEYIYESSENDLKALFNLIDSIDAQLSGKEIVVNTASGWERAAGLAVMYLGSISGGTYMLVNGFNLKGIVKSVALDIGVGTGLVLLGMTNPVLAIGAAIVVIWRIIAGGTADALATIKSKIGKTICDSINGMASEKSDQIAEDIEHKYTEIANMALEGIDIRLNAVREETEKILEEKRKGQQHADERNAVINKCEEKLKVICEKLDTLVFELAGLSSTAN